MLKSFFKVQIFNKSNWKIGYDLSAGKDRIYKSERVDKNGDPIPDGKDLSDWSETQSPTGDSDFTLDPRETLQYGIGIWADDSFGNYYTDSGRGNVRIKNERFACDPRLRRAAEDCLADGDLCGFDFDEIQDYAGTNLDAFDTG